MTARRRLTQHGATRVTVIALSALGILLAALLGAWFACPCERIPGGYLLGPVASDPVGDWEFANQVPLCQLEVAAFVPHSINLNCMSSEGRLYVSCSRCAGKFWSGVALDRPQGRIRVGETIFEVTMTRLTEPTALDGAWRARASKIARRDGAAPGPAPPRPDHWWSFELTSR